LGFVHAAERGEIGASACLDDVGGETMSRVDLAIHLDSDVNLTLRVPAGRDRFDVVVLKLCFDADRGIDRAEDRVDGSVAFQRFAHPPFVVMKQDDLSGRWFTASLWSDEFHNYVSTIGTAYAVMALQACRV